MLARIRKSAEEKDQGFTLIELLVVIIIIGILAAIAIPVFLNQRKKGVDAGLKSDLKNLATVEETYITDFPATQGIAVASGTGALTVGALPFRTTTGNTLEVIMNGTGLGYCIKAYHLGASVAVGPTTAGAVLTYNSSTGGLNQVCT